MVNRNGKSKHNVKSESGFINRNQFEEFWKLVFDLILVYAGTFLIGLKFAYTKFGFKLVKEKYLGSTVHHVIYI